MSGDASKLFSEPAQKLRAITINGAVHVESEDDIKKREERRKQRASRWDKGSAKKEEKVVIRNMPTIINSSAMDDKSQRIYIYKMQIQEATMKLARSDLGEQSCYVIHFVGHLAILAWCGPSFWKPFSTFSSPSFA